MKKRIEDPSIEEKLLEILGSTRKFISVANITALLYKEYKIKRSPQVIRRHLEKLKKEGKIIQQEYGKTS